MGSRHIPIAVTPPSLGVLNGPDEKASPIETQMMPDPVDLGPIMVPLYLILACVIFILLCEIYRFYANYKYNKKHATQMDDLVYVLNNMSRILKLKNKSVLSSNTAANLGNVDAEAGLAGSDGGGSQNANHNSPGNDGALPKNHQYDADVDSSPNSSRTEGGVVKAGNVKTHYLDSTPALLSQFRGSSKSHQQRMQNSEQTIPKTLAFNEPVKYFSPTVGNCFIELKSPKASHFSSNFTTKECEFSQVMFHDDQQHLDEHNKVTEVRETHTELEAMNDDCSLVKPNNNFSASNRPKSDPPQSGSVNVKPKSSFKQRQIEKTTRVTTTTRTCTSANISSSSPIPGSRGDNVKLVMEGLDISPVLPPSSRPSISTTDSVSSRTKPQTVASLLGPSTSKPRTHDDDLAQMHQFIDQTFDRLEYAVDPIRFNVLNQQSPGKQSKNLARSTTFIKSEDPLKAVVHFDNADIGEKDEKNTRQ